MAQLKARFAIDRVLFVADVGRRSKENLAWLTRQGYDYVVAARLRSMNAAETKKVTAADTGRAQQNVETSVLRDRKTNAYYALPAAATHTQLRHYKAVDQTLLRMTVLLKEGGS